MYRLFAALPVPEETRAVLARAQKGLTGASWRPVENFHITLRFFGDVDRHTAEALDEEIARITSPALSIRVEGAGWFGRREPYSVWARVAETDGLTQLSAACERAARRVGLPAEKRPFRPHVTLAYLHGATLEGTQRWVEAQAGLEAGPFVCDQFHLYSSHLGKGPSRYVAEADYVLGA